MYNTVSWAKPGMKAKIISFTDTDGTEYDYDTDGYAIGQVLTLAEAQSLGFPYTFVENNLRLFHPCMLRPVTFKLKATIEN